MKRFLCIITIAAMLLGLLSGCTSQRLKGSEVTTKKNPTVRTDIRYASAHDIVSLDPHSAVDVYSHEILNMIYERLLSLDEDGKIAAGLAEHWEVASYSEYIFHLRKDVKFHNGEELTALDVVFSLELARQSSTSSTALEGIESIQAIDKYTVRITTDGPYAPLLRNLTSSGIPILCKKYVEENEDYTEKPVGTGPMVFKEYTPNYSVVLERFDGYWGTKAIATSLTRMVIPESSARTIALETGEIDIIDSVPPVDIPRIVNNNNIRTVSQTSTALTYVSYNTRNAPFDDVKVRQALSSAVDKEAIIDVVCEGYAEAVNTIYPPAMPSYDETLNLYPHDIERAKKLLSESGYPDGFKIDIATSGEERNKIAQLLQSDFAKIGVDLNITLLEWGAYLDFIGGRNHQMYIIGWSSGTEPDGSTSPLFHSESVGPTGNRSWYQNEELDALIEKGRATIEEGERDAIYKEIQRIVMEDAVWIPLFVRENVIATNKNLKGLIISPTEAHIYVYSYVEQ